MNKDVNQLPDNATTMTKHEWLGFKVFGVIFFVFMACAVVRGVVVDAIYQSY